MDMHAVVWKAVDSIRSNRAEDLDVETVAEAVKCPAAAAPGERRKLMVFHDIAAHWTPRS